MYSISPHNCSYCFIHSIPIDIKVPLESKSQIFYIFFHYLCMLREMKLVLKSNFESLPSFKPSLLSLLSMSKRTLPSRYEEGTRFFLHNSGMTNSIRPFPIQNFMLLMMHLLMLLTTLNQISLYITICFKWSKTFEYIGTLLRKWN